MILVASLEAEKVIFMDSKVPIPTEDQRWYCISSHRRVGIHVLGAISERVQSDVIWNYRDFLGATSVLAVVIRTDRYGVKRLLSDLDSQQTCL